MKPTKHTPGPWKVIDGNEVYSGVTPIAQSWATVDEQEANARLIAAAPELLSALKALKEQLESEEADGHNRTVHLIVIDSAIAKAEGGDS